MPGKVIAVDVSEGQTVTAGQRLLVLEAMKMEHALTAPFDGVVAELNASLGAQVQVETLLVRGGGGGGGGDLKTPLPLAGGAGGGGGERSEPLGPQAPPCCD